MRGQRNDRPGSSGTRARPAVLRPVLGLLGVALASTVLAACGGDEPVVNRAARASSAPSAEVAGAVEASPGVALERPVWLPAEVPVPKRAEITSVTGDGRCAVVWLLSGADLQASAADLTTAAEKAGLGVVLTSGAQGTSPTASLPPEMSPDLLLEDPELLAPTPNVQMLGLRMKRAGQATLDVSLQLSSVGGGVVVGEYRVRAPGC